MYTTKEKRLIDKFSKENDLIYPLHSSDYDNPVRKEFITNLLHNETFVPTKDKAEEKYKEPLFKIIRNFDKKDYVFAGLIALLCSSVYCGMFSDYLFNHKDVAEKKQRITMNLLDLASIVAVVISGMGLSTLSIGSIKQSNQEVAVDKFYKRLSVRLFSEMKKMHPELKEETLKQCNPELARVIYTLLIANMSEKDTQKLWNIANTVSEYRYNKLYKGEIGDLKNRDQALQQAMVIIESHLINNPELARVILDVYHGAVPVSFIVKEQNTK